MKGFKSCMCCCEYCFKTVSLIEEKYRDILYCMWFLTTSIDYCVFYFFLDWYTLIIVNQFDICAFHWICIEIIQTIINTLNFKADTTCASAGTVEGLSVTMTWIELLSFCSSIKNWKSNHVKPAIEVLIKS